MCGHSPSMLWFFARELHPFNGLPFVYVSLCVFPGTTRLRQRQAVDAGMRTPAEVPTAQKGLFP